jgi:precorrin-2 dehydrogenase/sirohydrochlorin ferrochelatase
VSNWYPLMLKVEGRKCVVIGGGPVAERKIAGLLQANAAVYIVSPTITPALQEWAEHGQLHWEQREAEERDLQDAILVFAVTDQPNVNRWVLQTAGERGIPVNVADDGESGDFIVPAVIRQGDLVLTASASGAGPALTSRIIQELAERYGSEYKHNVELLRAIRHVVKAEVVDLSERRELLQAAVTEDALMEWRSVTWLSDKDKLLARLRQRVDDTKG